VYRFASADRGRRQAFSPRTDELIVGTVAPLRPEKNIGRLLRAFELLGNGMPVRLVIAGEGVERSRLERLSRELGISERVLFTGNILPEAVLGGFDVFALSSDTEQMPNSLLEAMASGRAVAAVEVGDVKDMVSEENRPFIVSRDDLLGFADSIWTLLQSSMLRERIGRCNRARSASEFSQERMFAAYEELFRTMYPAE
jgi:glycosyltransferase involved in cell wall biosynthesis